MTKGYLCYSLTVPIRCYQLKFFSSLQGKLEVRLLGCEDLLNAPAEQQNQSILPEDGSPTTPGSQGPPGETRLFKNELICILGGESPLLET